MKNQEKLQKKDANARNQLVTEKHELLAQIQEQQGEINQLELIIDQMGMDLQTQEEENTRMQN